VKNVYRAVLHRTNTLAEPQMIFKLNGALANSLRAPVATELVANLVTGFTGAFSFKGDRTGFLAIL